jgi:uncharacterized protein YjbJ (UPF0337 family)
MKDKVQGKAEELKGKLTGNKAEELKGKARQKAGRAKENLNEKADEKRRDEDRER